MLPALAALTRPPLEPSCADRAFCCFRMASILQGVYKRSLAGQSSSADGGAVGKLAGAVAQLGNKIADRYEKYPDRLTKAAGAGSTFDAVVKASIRTSASAGKAASKAAGMGDGEYAELKSRMVEFMHEEIYPNETAFAKQCHAASGSNEW